MIYPNGYATSHNLKIIQNGREVEMVTHRRVARLNSQDFRHKNRKSEGVVFKTAEMSEQGTLAGSNPASPTSYNKMLNGSLHCITFTQLANASSFNTNN